MRPQGGPRTQIMEFVFVIPRHELFSTSYPHGLARFGQELSEAAFHACVEEHGFFVEREYAERTPALKQVIPYTIVVRGSEPCEVLCLRRTKRGGERRLHDKLSIGVGGHINPVDLPDEAPRGVAVRRNPIPAATRREVAEEELVIRGKYELRSVGLLNDDSNPVGAVHVGFIQVLAVDCPVEVRETEQLTGQFVSPADLRRMREGGANLESWSSLLIQELDHLVPETVAS